MDMSEPTLAKEVHLSTLELPNCFIQDTESEIIAMITTGRLTSPYSPDSRWAISSTSARMTPPGLACTFANFKHLTGNVNTSNVPELEGACEKEVFIHSLAARMS